MGYYEMSLESIRLFFGHLFIVADKLYSGWDDKIDKPKLIWNSKKLSVTLNRNMMKICRKLDFKWKGLKFVFLTNE